MFLFLTSLSPLLLAFLLPCLVRLRSELSSLVVSSSVCAPRLGRSLAGLPSRGSRLMRCFLLSRSRLSVRRCWVPAVSALCVAVAVGCASRFRSLCRGGSLSLLPVLRCRCWFRGCSSLFVGGALPPFFTLEIFRG